MTAVTTSETAVGRDGLLRLTMRADAIITGLAGVAGVPLAHWTAELAGTTPTIEYSMSAFFIVYGVVVFALSVLRPLPSIRRAGAAVVAANLLYTVGAVAIVVAGVWPLTTAGIVIMLASGVYTLVFADLQYLGLRRLR